MKVMVVGSGGREHAICWALSVDPTVSEVVAAPGNPGIAAMESCRCLPVPPSDFAALADAASAESVDVTVVGPEAPLAEGLADFFSSRGLSVFGPCREAARLESSKSFAKELMKRMGVPTPEARAFTGLEALQDALDFLSSQDPPWVVKADGLAAGKGVLVTSDPDSALDWVRGCLSGEKFGAAGRTVLVESFAPGKEASVLVVTDGKDILALPPARDHKRLLDGDEGPNTGGMGAFSPVPEIDPVQLDYVIEKVFEPVLYGLAREGAPYVGVLYGGLVLTEEGPKVLEFNVRFGDPEAQAVLPRLGPCLGSVIDSTLSGELDRVSLPVEREAALTVVAASRGYPERPETGMPIEGLDEAEEDPDVLVFHAGTALDSEGRLITAGGRVLAVSAVGSDLEAARTTAYGALSKISFEGMHYRRDIAAPVGS